MPQRRFQFAAGPRWNHRGLSIALAAALSAVHMATILASDPPAISSNQPSILSDPALNRVPQDFAGLPSLLADDPYVPPLLWPVDPPLGYTGPSGILPREEQQSSHFVPMEDRWRIGFPE